MRHKIRHKMMQLMTAFVISFIIGMPVSFGFSIGTPTATVIDDRSVQINWTTSEPSGSKINYGTTALSEVKEDPTLTDNHSVILTGLISDQDYKYEVASENESGHEEKNDNSGSYFTFKTYETVEISGLRAYPVSETDENVFYQVNWTTSIATDGQVMYGNVSDNLTDTVAGASSTGQHSVEIRLGKGQTYFYQAQSSYKKSVVMSVDVPFDITPPEISIDNFDDETKYIIKSGAVNTGSFALRGDVEPNASVAIYNNLMKVGEIDVGDSGEIDAVLDVNNGFNRYVVEVSDNYGNKASFSFNITADVLEPIITLYNFESSTINESIVLNMSLNEEALVEVFLNKDSVSQSSGPVLNFTAEIKLDDDENNLTIIATDKAGNAGRLTEFIGKIGPPDIKITYPVPDDETGYVATTLKEIMIKGITTPYSVVTVYEKIDDSNFKEPTDFIANTTADANGYFEVEIELASSDFDFSSVFQEEDSTRYIGGTKDEIVSYFNTHNETRIIVGLEATDIYGRKSLQKTELTFFSTPCDVPGKFVVSLLPDTHYFKPYRLRDGTETLTLNIELTWRGFSPNYRIRSVVIRPQQKFQKYIGEESYECFISGGVFKNAQLIQSVSNENQTFWSFVYQLSPWKGLNDSKVGDIQEAWKSLVNNNCNIPLEIHVEYETTSIISSVTPLGEVIPAGQWMPPEKMVKCAETSNLIQEAADSSKVLPQELLDAGISVLNATHEFLAQISPIIKWVHYGAGAVCLGYLGTYLVKKAYNTGICTAAMEAYKKNHNDADLQGCVDAIQKEKDLYNHYRVACDRVLCKTTPVNPTKHPLADKEAGVLDVDTMMVGSKDKPDKCLPATKYTCYDGELNEENLRRAGCVETGTRYTLGDVKQKAVNAIIFDTDDCKNSEGKFCCLKASYNTGKVTSIAYKGQDNWLSKPDPSTDKELFVDEPWNYGEFAGYFGETIDTLKLVSDTWFSQRTEVSSDTKEKIKSPPVVNYVEGLHGPSCFNQGSVWLGSKRAFFEPTQNFRSALQCGCVSQIRGYVDHWERLTGEMLRCLQEAKEGDTFTAAACEELFTQFICDLFTYVIVEFVMGKLDEAFTKNKVDDAEHTFGEGLASGFKEAGTMFADDYKESFHGNFDIGVSSLSHAVCMAAFTGEWEGLGEGVLGIGDKTPPRQSTVFISTADAELLSANPLTGSATFEYTMGIWLQPGSDLLNYRVELVCDYEGDCPAVTEAIPFITSDGEFPGIKTDIKQTDPTETPAGHMRVDNKFIRYNKIRVCWTSASGPDFSADPPNCVERDIGGWSVAMFGCALEPTKALSGNKIFSCPKYISDQYAEFAQLPPDDWAVDVTTSPQTFKIPFKIKAEYGQTAMEEKPFLIQYKQVAGEGDYIQEGVESIREGYTDENDYGFQFTVRESDFRLGREIAKVERLSGSGNSGLCQELSKDGTVTGSGSVVINWPSGQQLKDSMFSYPDEGFEFITSQQLLKDGAGEQIRGKYQAIVEFRIKGKYFKLKLEEGDQCKVTVDMPESVASDKIIKKFMVSLHKSRAGDPYTPDAVIVRRGNIQQEKEITVTLTNKIGSGSQQQEQVSADTEKINIDAPGTSNLLKSCISPDCVQEIEITVSTDKVLKDAGGNDVDAKINLVEVRLEDSSGLLKDFVANPFNAKSVSLLYRLPADLRDVDHMKVIVTDSENKKVEESIKLSFSGSESSGTPLPGTG